MDAIQFPLALGRDTLVGPDPTWESIPTEIRTEWNRRIADFPPPPLFLQVMDSHLSLERFNPSELAQAVASDAVLTAKLLARANSAAFGLSQAILTLPRAIVQLGFNLVRSTVLRHQVETAASTLPGVVKYHILQIQQKAEQGAIIAYHWANHVKHPDPASLATLCLLARLGTFVQASAQPSEMDAYFAMGHEPQRMAFEANHFGLTTRSLSYRVARIWGLPEQIQIDLFSLWNPLFAADDNIGHCIACASLCLGFDPPVQMDDVLKWLSLRCHRKLRRNLQHNGLLERIPNFIDSEAYRREVAVAATMSSSEI